MPNKGYYAESTGTLWSGAGINCCATDRLIERTPLVFQVSVVTVYLARFMALTEVLKSGMAPSVGQMCYVQDRNIMTEATKTEANRQVQTSTYCNGWIHSTSAHRFHGRRFIVLLMKHNTPNNKT